MASKDSFVLVLGATKDRVSGIARSKDIRILVAKSDFSKSQFIMEGITD